MGLELLAISLGLCTFGPWVNGRNMVVHCDNTGSEVSTRKGSAKRWDHAQLVRAHWLYAAKNNLQLIIKRVSTHDNIADLPSHLVRSRLATPCAIRIVCIGYRLLICCEAREPEKSSPVSKMLSYQMTHGRYLPNVGLYSMASNCPHSCRIVVSICSRKHLVNSMRSRVSSSKERFTFSSPLRNAEGRAVKGCGAYKGQSSNERAYGACARPHVQR